MLTRTSKHTDFSALYGGSYRYGYNGKEKDDEVKGEGNSYDFGARIYDPRVARWLSRDAHFDKYPYYSPYIGMGNNPISLTDPDGKDIIDFMLLNSGKSKNTFKVITSSSVYMSWLGNFADINNNPESKNLGFTSSGARKDINLAFKVTKLPDGSGGSTETTFKGKPLSMYTADELGGASMDDFQILITLSENAGDMNGEALLNVLHESGLHAENQATMLDQFQSGQINAAQLIEKYNQLSAGEGEKDHLEITPGVNATYEGMIKDAKSVLKDVTTKTNRVYKLDVTDEPGKPGSANTGLLEAYGKYSPTKDSPNNWKNHTVNLYEMFSFSVDFHKEHQYNPKKRGMPLNALPAQSTIKE
jgi:RHS repeat-associated protein